MAACEVAGWLQRGLLQLPCWQLGLRGIVVRRCWLAMLGIVAMRVCGGMHLELFQLSGYLCGWCFVGVACKVAEMAWRWLYAMRIDMKLDRFVNTSFALMPVKCVR